MSSKIQNGARGLRAAHWAYYAGLYAVAHGLILIMYRGELWDDFMMQKVPLTNLIEAYRMEGYLNFIPVLKAFYALPSLDATFFAFRAMTFLSFFFAMPLLDGVLRRVRGIGAQDRFFLVLLFGLLPLSGARLCAGFSHFYLSHFFFYLAFRLTAAYLERRRTWLRIAALVFFLASFFTPSFLVLYTAVAAYVLYAEHVERPLTQGGLPRRLSGLIPAYADFLALPFVFWAARTFLFHPYGWRAHYNAVTLSGLAKAPVEMAAGFFLVWDQLSALLLESVAGNGLAVFIGSVIVFFCVRRAIPFEKSAANTPKLFAVGLALFAVGLFPYVAVGKIPEYYGSNSRHQLLLPLGAAWTVYYGWKWLVMSLEVGGGVALYAMSLFLALCVNMDVSDHLAYQRASFKRASLVDRMWESPVLRDHDTFLIRDEAADLEVRGKGLTFFDYAFFFHMAFDDATRFATTEVRHFGTERFERIMSFRAYKEYHFQDYEPAATPAPEYEVTVKKGRFELTPRHVCKMMVFRFLRPDEFRRDLANVVDLEFTKT